MFEKKITIQNGRLPVKKKPAEAIQALANTLGIRFEVQPDFNGGQSYLVARDFSGDHKPISAYTEDRNTFARYTIEDAVNAIAEALGLEFRAEYVVGSSTPALKAVKKTAARAAK